MKTRLTAAAAALSSAVLFITEPSIFAGLGEHGSGNPKYLGEVSGYSGVSAGYSGAMRGYTASGSTRIDAGSEIFWTLDGKPSKAEHVRGASAKRSLQRDVSFWDLDLMRKLNSPYNATK